MLTLLFLLERYLRISKSEEARTTAIDRHKVRMTNQQCVHVERQTLRSSCV